MSCMVITNLQFMILKKLCNFSCLYYVLTLIGYCPQCIQFVKCRWFLFLCNLLLSCTIQNVWPFLTKIHVLCSTVERTDKLHNKVKNLNECLLNNTEIDVGDRTGGPGIVAKKQSLFYKGTRPSAVSFFSWINSKVLLTFISKLLLLIDNHNDLLRCGSWLSADYFCIVFMISWISCGCNCCTAASIMLYHVTHLNSSLSWTLIFIRLSYILKKTFLLILTIISLQIKLKYEESEKTPPLHQFLDLMSVDDIDQGAQPHVSCNYFTYMLHVKLSYSLLLYSSIQTKKDSFLCVYRLTSSKTYVTDCSTLTGFLIHAYFELHGKTVDK